MNFAFCYEENNAEMVDEIIVMLKRAGSSLGMKLEGSPHFIEVPDN
jgi:hypothetical protein